MPRVFFVTGCGRGTWPFVTSPSVHAMSRDFLMTVACVGAGSAIHVLLSRLPQKQKLYVSIEDADGLMRDWLLVESDRPNVKLHVVESLPDENRLPLAWVLADLADRGGPREDQRVRDLVKEIDP